MQSSQELGQSSRQLQPKASGDSNGESPGETEGLGGAVQGHFSSSMVKATLRKEEQEFSEMLEVVKSAGLKYHVAELFCLLGLHRVEDLLLVDSALVQELTAQIRANGFKAEANFENQAMRGKYLGNGFYDFTIFQFTTFELLRLKGLQAVAGMFLDKKKEMQTRMSLIQHAEVNRKMMAALSRAKKKERFAFIMQSCFNKY